MVSEALPVQHSCAFDSQGVAQKYSAAVRMQEEHCGFPSRFVHVLIYADMTVFKVLFSLWLPHTWIDGVSDLYF